MPTILKILGWRLFFYSNENNEPIHIHCRKADMECKFWLDCEQFEIKEAFAYNMNNRDKREIRKITFSGSIMTLEIDGQTKSFHLENVSRVLSNASDTEKMTYEVSPSGYGIHWPLLDEDISIDGLLGIAHTSGLSEHSSI